MRPLSSASAQNSLLYLSTILRATPLELDNIMAEIAIQALRSPRK